MAAHPAALVMMHHDALADLRQRRVDRGADRGNDAAPLVPGDRRVFGTGGYFFGKLLLQLHHALAPIVFALALAAFFGCGYLVRRYEDRLTASAERALPGPLVAEVDKKRP